MSDNVNYRIKGRGFAFGFNAEFDAAAMLVLGLFLVMLAVAVNMAGCQQQEVAPAAQGNAAQFMPATASWYGPVFHGRTTASGEPFRRTALTAAHRTLPFGSLVIVQRGDRAVMVRINDRGPFIWGRQFDLSEAAARELGMLEAGVVPVQWKPWYVPQPEDELVPDMEPETAELRRY